MSSPHVMDMYLGIMYSKRGQSGQLSLIKYILMLHSEHDAAVSFTPPPHTSQIQSMTEVIDCIKSAETSSSLRSCNLITFYCNYFYEGKKKKENYISILILSLGKVNSLFTMSTREIMTGIFITNNCKKEETCSIMTDVPFENWSPCPLSVTLVRETWQTAAFKICYDATSPFSLLPWSPIHYFMCNTLSSPPHHVSIILSHHCH